MIARESAELTPDEREVVELVVAGLTDEHIARRLGVGTATVQRRLRAAASALGTRSRVELAVRALSRGLVPPPEEDPQDDAGADSEAK